MGTIEMECHELQDINESNTDNWLTQYLQPVRDIHGNGYWLCLASLHTMHPQSWENYPKMYELCKSKQTLHICQKVQVGW